MTKQKKTIRVIRREAEHILKSYSLFYEYSLLLTSIDKIRFFYIHIAKQAFIIDKRPYALTTILSRC